MSRRSDRRHAFTLVFQAEFQPELGAEDAFARYRESAGISETADFEFIRELFSGTLEHKAEIDAIISENVEGWGIGRISKADLAVLRLCVYELAFSDKSKKVAANEAVELAKLFSPDETGAFVNGIVAKIIRKLSEANG